MFEHVPIQPRDAREASDVFYKQKTGDALLTYENEVQTWPLVLPHPALLPQSAHISRLPPRCGAWLLHCMAWSMRRETHEPHCRRQIDLAMCCACADA